MNTNTTFCLIIIEHLNISTWLIEVHMRCDLFVCTFTVLCSVTQALTFKSDSRG